MGTYCRWSPPSTTARNRHLTDSPPVRPGRLHGCTPSTSRSARAPAGRCRGAAVTRAYGGDWEHFRRWCVEHGWHPLSAAAETVDAYLTVFAGMLATSMLSRRRTVVRTLHQVAGLDSPSEHPVAPKPDERRTSEIASPSSASSNHG
jgi:hypothetical protein